MKIKLWRSFVLILAAGWFASAAPSQEVTPRKIRVLTLLGRPLQITVAETRGFFAKYGVAVETDNSSSSDELRAKLAAGKGDVAYAAVDNAVAMVELAKADVVIVAGGEGSQNELIAQADIKSIKDLRGKTLIVDAPNTAYALQMKKILLLNGLTQADYEIKPYGVTPLRLTAMREHKEAQRAGQSRFCARLDRSLSSRRQLGAAQMGPRASRSARRLPGGVYRSTAVADGTR